MHILECCGKCPLIHIQKAKDRSAMVPHPNACWLVWPVLEYWSHCIPFLTVFIQKAGWTQTLFFNEVFTNIVPRENFIELSISPDVSLCSAVAILAANSCIFQSYHGQLQTKFKTSTWCFTPPFCQLIPHSFAEILQSFLTVLSVFQAVDPAKLFQES